MPTHVIALSFFTSQKPKKQKFFGSFFQKRTGFLNSPGITLPWRFPNFTT
jgi:hypothetical protein